MKTKIKSLTVINKDKTIQYVVGNFVNGMVIDTIKDCSNEWPDGIEFIYDGVNKDGDVIFSVINAPVVLEYYPSEED